MFDWSDKVQELGDEARIVLREAKKFKKEERSRNLGIPLKIPDCLGQNGQNEGEEFTAAGRAEMTTLRSAESPDQATAPRSGWTNHKPPQQSSLQSTNHRPRPPEVEGISHCRARLAGPPSSVLYQALQISQGSYSVPVIGDVRDGRDGEHGERADSDRVIRVGNLDEEVVKQTAADVSHGSNGKTVVKKNSVSEHRESDVKVEYVSDKPHESVKEAEVTEGVASEQPESFEEEVEEDKHTGSCQLVLKRNGKSFKDQDEFDTVVIAEDRKGIGPVKLVI
jgi:hypothetical protein